jgi:hypothetical protein
MKRGEPKNYHIAGRLPKGIGTQLDDLMDSENYSHTDIINEAIPFWLTNRHVNQMGVFASNLEEFFRTVEDSEAKLFVEHAVRTYSKLHDSGGFADTETSPQAVETLKKKEHRKIKPPITALHLVRPIWPEDVPEPKTEALTVTKNV